ncbi:unnamed protein product, partial [Ranitomeya imitator]
MSISLSPSSEVPEFLSDFQDVFDEPKSSSLPPHRDCDCAINLIPGCKFPKGRLFNLSVPEHAAMRNYVKESLEKGHFRPSSSPLGAGFFFVAKKDGSLRPCIDYRLLNKITVKFRYPLPWLSDLFARIKGASWFTKINLRGAYNLVRIKQGDEWKTAFNTPEGHFEYLVMPFGLSNAPSVFQSFMHDIFRNYLDKFMIVYLDDILVFSDDWEYHVKQVRMVFQVLPIEMDPVKVQAIHDWTQPTSVKSLQKFLGFANFYRRFIVNFSSVAKPLTDLTRKGADVVEVDASEIGAGAVLSQRNSDGSLMKPCAFFSRKFSSSERNYDVGNRELLAMKWAFEEWRHWLEGAKHRVVVLTDHKNLIYLESAKRLNPRQARWSLFFSRFDFVVSYIPGSKNVKADALSRSFFLPDSPGVLEPAGILKEGVILSAISPDLRRVLQEFQADKPDRCPVGKLLVPDRWTSRTNGQTERTNQTLETYLRCFVSADQDDWVTFLPLAEFALNNRARQLEPSDCPGVDSVVDRLQQIWTHVVDNLTLSQEKAQRFANRRRCVGPRLRVGDLVWLSSRHVPMKVSSPKFKPRFIGPYKISEIINPVSFRLALPASFSIHRVFHRSLLRRYVVPMVPSVDPPAPVLVEGELEYVVEKILDSRFSRRKLQYLVKWKGYGLEDNSWVVASDVHAPDLVHAFHLARPDRPGSSGILHLASGVVDLLQYFFPESFDRLPRDCGLFDGPKPTVLDSCCVSDLAILLRGNKRKTQPIEFGAHQVILVVNEKAKDNIPEELSLALVLTIYEAKGLEFDDVLLYNFFTDSEASKEWRIISSFNPAPLKKTGESATSRSSFGECLEIRLHRSTVLRRRGISRRRQAPEQEERHPSERTDSQFGLGADIQHYRMLYISHERFSFSFMLNGELKQLYTAITRARVNLWIFDENHEKRAPAFDYFVKGNLVQVVQTDKNKDLDDNMFVKTSTKKEWISQGDYYASHQCWKRLQLLPVVSGHMVPLITVVNMDPTSRIGVEPHIHYCNEWYHVIAHYRKKLPAPGKQGHRARSRLEKYACAGARCRGDCVDDDNRGCKVLPKRWRNEKEKLAFANDEVLNLQTKKSNAKGKKPLAYLKLAKTYLECREPMLSLKVKPLAYLKLAKTYLECREPMLSLKCLMRAKEFVLCADLCKRLEK